MNPMFLFAIAIIGIGVLLLYYMFFYKTKYEGTNKMFNAPRKKNVMVLMNGNWDIPFKAEKKGVKNGLPYYTCWGRNGSVVKKVFDSDIVPYNLGVPTVFGRNTVYYEIKQEIETKK